MTVPHDVNKQIELILRKTWSSFSCSDNTVREKHSFLTKKTDNDSLLLLHDSGSLSDEEFLLLYDMKKSNLTIFWVKL